MYFRLPINVQAWLFTMLLLCFGIYSSAQSCLIVNVGPEEIVAGADSKATKTELVVSGEKISVHRTSLIKSKIREANHFYYALGGEGFGMDSIIKKMAAENKSFDLFVHLCRYKIQEHLGPLLEEARKRDTGFIRKNFPGTQITQILFFCFEKSLPRVIVVWFGVAPIMTSPVEVSSGFKEIVNNHAAIGIHEAFEDEFDDQANWVRGSVAAIHYFIKKQINSAPNDLAEPIILLRLTKNRAEWNPPIN